MLDDRKYTATLAVLTFAAATWCSGVALAQNRYDDHELTDRFYITIGGYEQDDIRTTLRLDATSSSGVGVGTVVGLETLFDLDNEVSAVRLDGWYRFNKKHRINWTYWDTDRSGLRTYNDDNTIEIGDIVIEPGDTVTTEDDQTRIALSWSYSFVNTSKYEAWVGVGVNTYSVDYRVSTTIGTGGSEEAKAKGTIPLPVINYGGRWNFSRGIRMLLQGQIFDVSIGDYSGRLDNTRVVAEFNITKHFGIGGGLERNEFQVDAEDKDFMGELDTSYTAFTLYLKGQL